MGKVIELKVIAPIEQDQDEDDALTIVLNSLERIGITYEVVDIREEEVTP